MRGNINKGLVEENVTKNYKYRKISNFLSSTYGKKNLNVLEIGGYEFTVVPDTIAENNYIIELDSCEKYLMKNMELTCESKESMEYILSVAPLGYVFNHNTRNFERNTRQSILPFRESSFDVIFLFHYPMYTRLGEELKYFFSELSRVLKDFGEIVVCPNFDNSKFLDDLFDKVYEEPCLLVLKKMK
jgi:hypothetical protein